VSNKVSGLIGFNPNYSLKEYNEEVLMIDGDFTAKSEAFYIICDFLYQHLKESYKNISYVKVPILVPQRI
jgi:hypothetical protein